MRSMAASSDFDVIERERKRGEEKERERKRGKRADTSSITFSNGGYTVMSDESIFGAPPRGGGRRPEGAGATRGAAVVRVKRDGTTGMAGYARR